jgi:hypothetical protein
VNRETYWTHIGTCGHVIYHTSWFLKGADIVCDQCCDVVQVKDAPIVAILHCGTCDRRLYTGGRMAAQGRYANHGKKYPGHYMTLTVNGRLEWESRDVNQLQLDPGEVAAF